MNELVMHAMCKINIGLDITGRRDDGYHEIRSVMHTLELHDVMRFSVSDELTVNCPGIPQEENIVTRAVRECMKYAGVSGGLKADMEKHIPSQAGLGGGSTDAACAIRACSMLWGLELSADEMRGIALRVGADVPFLVEGGCAVCEGIGEELTPVPMGPAWSVLIVMPPSLRVDTASAYRWMDSAQMPAPSDPSGVLEMLRRGCAVTSPVNAFERYIARISPESLSIRDELISLGAFASGLSGSGSAFYGLFRDDETMNDAAQAMKKRCETVIPSRLCGSSYRIIS